MTNIIVLTPEVAEQLETVRLKGHYTMYDFNSTQRRANDLEFYPMVIWMENNKNKWLDLVINGFVVDMGDGSLLGHREYFEKFPIETEIEDG